MGRLKPIMRYVLLVSFATLALQACKPSECASTEAARSAAKSAIYGYPETGSEEVETKSKALVTAIGDSSENEFKWLSNSLTELAKVMPDQRRRDLKPEERDEVRSDLELKMTRARDALKDVDR